MNRKQRRRDISDRRAQGGLEAAGAAADLRGKAYKLRDRGKFEQAAEACEKLLQIDPASAETLFLLGDVQFGLKRFAKAVLAYGEGLSLEPEHAIARRNMIAAMTQAGSELFDRGALDKAEQCFREALKQSPDDVRLLVKLAVALQMQWKVDDAMEIFRRAIALDPHNAENLVGLGTAFAIQGNLEEASQCYAHAINLQPEFATAHDALLCVQQYILRNSDEDISRAVSRYREIFVESPIARRQSNKDPSRRLRIGYMSGNLRENPVAFFLEGVLAAHDRASFEIFCYSTSAINDKTTDRLRAIVDRWCQVEGLTPVDLAKLLAHHRLDIIVDLDGHTAGNTLHALAYRPAPIQASWLGYSETIGLRELDYVIMDRHSVSSHEPSFLEAIVRLPRSRFCMSPPSDAPAPAEPPSTRTGFVTFGSFNNIVKLSPEAIATWSAILKNNPSSRLLLKWGTLNQSSVASRLTAAFAACGIAAERLILRGYSAFDQMLAEYGDVDIALDPFPFGGGMTSCLALWMGVPIITMPCTRPVSKQTAGFLNLLGIDELISTSIEDYVTRATALAHDPTRLRELRELLRPTVAASPLCDGPLITRDIEAAYREMWRRFCIGESPASFAVPDET